MDFIKKVGFLLIFLFVVAVPVKRGFLHQSILG